IKQLAVFALDIVCMALGAITVEDRLPVNFRRRNAAGALRFGHFGYHWRQNVAAQHEGFASLVRGHVDSLEKRAAPALEIHGEANLAVGAWRNRPRRRRQLGSGATAGRMHAQNRDVAWPMGGDYIDVGG